MKPYFEYSFSNSLTIVFMLLNRKILLRGESGSRLLVSQLAFRNSLKISLRVLCSSMPRVSIASLNVKAWFLYFFQSLLYGLNIHFGINSVIKSPFFAITQANYRYIYILFAIPSYYTQVNSMCNVRLMKTEDVELNIKEIFERKKVAYNSSDIARMRYLCKQFVEYVIENQKECKIK